MATTGPDESRDDSATLKSLVAEATDEHDRKFDSSEGRSPAVLKWRNTANLLRAIQSFKYLEEDPPDEAVPEIQRTRIRTLSVKSQSTGADESKESVADLRLETAETKDEVEQEHLKPLALKYRLAASFLSTFLPQIFRKDGTIRTTLLDMIDIQVEAKNTPVDGFFTTDVVIDKAADLWARIFTPVQSKEPNPVVFYIHGGGYAMYGPGTMDYDKLGRKIAKALNAVVISVKYRLSPVSRYPNQHDDIFKALEWLRNQKPGSKYLPATADVSQCFLAGDSAGGNAVHHVGCRAAAADLGPVKIRGWFMLQPFFGGVERTESEQTLKNPLLLTNYLADWFWTAFLPHGADRDHEAANVFGPNARDISGLPLPPIFVIIGTHDILKDREAAYAKEMAKIVGKDNVLVKKYVGGFHAFFAYDSELQKVLMVDLASFVRGVLAKQKS